MAVNMDCQYYDKTTLQNNFITQIDIVFGQLPVQYGILSNIYFLHKKETRFNVMHLI